MKSIGFLTLKKHQELSYFTNIALESLLTIVEIYRFTPLDINPITEQVSGYKFNKSTKNWEQSVFSIPTYIYDRCFYNNENLSEKSLPIVRWLKERPSTTFLGYGLPNKWEVYHSLSSQYPISSYLPKTVHIFTFEHLKNFLDKEKTIVIKPISGSQGNGLFQIKLQHDLIQIYTQKQGLLFENEFTNLKDFKRFIEKLLIKGSYIAQKFIIMQQDKQPYDIRILLQKNKDGCWIEQGRGARVGKKNGLVSNLHNGGKVVLFEVLLNKISIKQRDFIHEEILTITRYLPPILEENFGRLFELGLDIGISDNGSVWLLDINSKPGRKVINFSSPLKKAHLLQAPLNYLNYLEQQQVTI